MFLLLQPIITVIIVVFKKFEMLSLRAN